MFSFLRRDIKKLGPGFITGASDDDPSGIATYSQAGAHFGFLTLWSVFLTIPLMIAVQEMCARVAIVTKRGLITNLRMRHSRVLVGAVVLLLLIANTINLGADLGMMASTIRLLMPLPFNIALIVIAMITLTLQIFTSYQVYARYLKWLTLSLFAYIGVTLVVHVDWGAALSATIFPRLSFSRDYLLILVALLGTTISPYLFFWQANQEVEENQVDILGVYGQSTHPLQEKLHRMRFDTTVGMIFSNLVAWFIILSTAAVLFTHGIRDIQSADQAAAVLTPFVGPQASLLFAIGVLGAGFLTIPIFSSTVAYSITEFFGLSGGLSKKWSQAKLFYGVVIAATILGGCMNLLGISPVRALIYAAVINGVISAPLLLLIIHLGNDRRIMQKQVNGRWSNIFGWVAFAVMALAPIALAMVSW